MSKKFSAKFKHSAPAPMIHALRCLDSHGNYEINWVDLAYGKAPTVVYLSYMALGRIEAYYDSESKKMNAALQSLYGQPPNGTERQATIKNIFQIFENYYEYERQLHRSQSLWR